ncbi:MAG: helicase-related protein [Gemmatimonadaceae bacterium]
MSDVAVRSLKHVQSAISTRLISDAATIPETLGNVSLRHAQRDVASRLAALISLHGGAMLAEPVGLGKTYASLAAAATFDCGLTIAAPAALRAMWQRALADCGVEAVIVSHESLSRGIAPRNSPGFIIVDESHRFRTRTTCRYAALADLCRRAKVLLVTATPVQNRRADLAAQLALFLGRGAWTMTDDQLGEHVVRESTLDVDGQPALRGPYTVEIDGDSASLEAILALPPPIPARGESLAVALSTFGLVHQWTSSQAAFVASLERRRARGLSLLAAMEAGRHPTRRELSAWAFAGDSLQLAFPELVVSASSDEAPSAERIRASLLAYDAAIADLLRRMRGGANDDLQRADAVRQIRARHPHERVIAFSHYAETVNALWTRLASDAGVAALTSHGSRVAGGRISRDDVLAQFTPGTDTVVPACEYISLLITTDLLSEGLNLQEASVIVHLDLPWNPARLEQRVGRARRLGSRHAAVTVYSLKPPAPAERLLRIEQRLREKLAIAAAAIGRSPPVLPSLVVLEAGTRGHVEMAGDIVCRLRAWRSQSPEFSDEAGAILVAAADADAEGFLALVIEDARPRLVASVDGRIATSAVVIHQAIVASESREAAVDHIRLASIIAEIKEWSDRRRGAAATTVRSAVTTPARRTGLQRIARLLSTIPHHQRSRMAPLAAAARLTLASQLSEGAERMLHRLVHDESANQEWLEGVAELGRRYARDPRASISDRDGEIVALILLQRSNSSYA